MDVAVIERQRIPTSGARAVEAFGVDGLELVAIAQLAVDVPGQAANMNGGDSDTHLLLLRWSEEGYVPFATLPAPGGEDAEFFMIGDRAFLAVASIRTGAGPYQYTTESVIYTWQAGGFVHFQSITTFAAKQWKHWTVGDRHFLALAQGVVLPGLEQHNRSSIVYEWDGSSFVEFQHVPSQWAYNWHQFRIGDTCFVAHAEHLGPSVLYRWDGQRLAPHQELTARGGRAFVTFEREGACFLVVASLLEAPRVMRWEGDRFEDIQELDELGARELAVIERGSRLFVVRINFIVGTPADPIPGLTSQIYEWDSGALRVVAEFPTSGGTDVAVVEHDDDLQLVVSNALSADVRFASETVLYSLELAGGRDEG